jgi:membrane-bound lytic murein transglycosylase D
MEERFPMTNSALVRTLRSAAALVLMAGLGACANLPTPASASLPDIDTAPLLASPAAAASAAASASEPADAASAPAVAQAASAPEPAAVDPLRPEVRLDLDDRAARIDLWQRVRAGFRLVDLDNERVHESERWYQQRPDYVQRMTERGSRYLFHIVEEVEKRGMPTEIALLPFIESAFNPEAMSSARASGMWQFIPSTGRTFELTQNVFRDDRRDVLASTRAALDYLQKLYGMFGDWHLALAAYNWGEGNVQRAVARNQRLHRPTDYDSLFMPRETRYYVPKLQAVKNIVAHPETFGLSLPTLSNHPYFLAVPIERDIDIDVAARLSGLSVEDFKALNPQMNRPVILAAGTPQVLLPYDNANLFVHSLRRHTGALATWTAWVVPKNMKPAEAAKQVGMDEASLRDVNRIPPHMLVRAGSTLLVPRSAQRQADVSEHLAENATVSFAPDAPAQRKIVLKAGKRDSVASIARRYRVSATQLAQWNGTTSGAKFRPGETVLVYVAAKVAPDKTASTARKPAAKASPKAVAKTSRPSKSKARVAAK